MKPRLLVVIDTEEDNWTSDYSPGKTSVQAMRDIHRIQAVFDTYQITPVYVVDYPIVSQVDGYRPLQEIHASGRCVIGTHLHPWVNPPLFENFNRHNSFPGNLPASLEAEKLRILGDCIGERFGERPVVYKAGRYGVGPHTADLLEQHGYLADLSVHPHMSYAAQGGPDFSARTAWPYWFGTRSQLLELPVTIGFAGMLRRWGSRLHDVLSQTALAPLHLVGIFARLRLINKIHLSPEGFPFAELSDLVRDLYRDGLRVFSFAFHSPSVAPGHTPYVQSEQDVEDFITRCAMFFDFFLGELGGQATTPLDLRHELQREHNGQHTTAQN